MIGPCQQDDAKPFKKSKMMPSLLKKQVRHGLEGYVPGLFVEE